MEREIAAIFVATTQGIAVNIFIKMTNIAKITQLDNFIHLPETTQLDTIFTKINLSTKILHQVLRHRKTEEIDLTIRNEIIHETKIMSKIIQTRPIPKMIEKLGENREIDTKIGETRKISKKRKIL